MSFIYGEVFHEKMTAEVSHFFKDLSYVGFGTFIGTAFLFIFNVLVGRLLGPLGYGEFSLVQSISMFLYIPMLMGYNNAMVKYNAEEDNFDKQRDIISTTCILVFLFTIVSVFAYLLIPRNLLEYFSVSSEVFHLSIVFAVLFVVSTLMINTLNGLHMMKEYAMVTPIHSSILLVSFLYVTSIKMVSYKSTIFTIFFAYIVISSLIFIFIHKYFTWKFDKSLAFILTNYGIYTVIGSLTFILYANIDKILINMFMSTEDLGIFNAYYFASINIAFILFNVFNGVFFPVASKYKDKTAIFEKINKITPYLIGLGIPFIILVEFVILNIFGEAYRIDIPLIIAFAVVSILTVYYGICNWTFCSEGMEGVKLVNKSAILMAIINIIVAIYFIPCLGLIGAMVSTAIAFIVGICFLNRRRHIIYSKSSPLLIDQI